MLGAARASRYEVDAGEWPVDGELVLYTDGVVERRGEPVDAGVARLAAVLDAERPGRRDWTTIVRETVGEPRADDACILTATRVRVGVRASPLGGR